MNQHLFTVDVEEYFHVAALEPYAPRAQWQEFETRLLHGLDLLLELLATHGATGTFFTLGIVAERHPEAVKRIAAAGHEVASHGWSHKRVTDLSPREFRDEVARSRDLLSELSGQAVTGYRAPNFSIIPGYEWAYDILVEEGYKYDSSVFPGRASAPRERRRGAWIMKRSRGDLLELPMTRVQIGPARLPSAGGAWFRLFPYELTRRALQQAAQAGVPGVFYIHPWELDPQQPRLQTNLRTRIRHYGGLSATTPRIDQMLSEFSFVSVAKWLAQRPALVGAA
jgi:polysaccharide deacetylase family protein (PEP-CTERM system associated)